MRRITMHVEMNNGEFCIEAGLLGNLFEVEPAAIPVLMRDGVLTGVCERGIGEDDGKYRLSFFYASRRVRLNVDAAGAVLQRSVVDFGDQPLPRAMRRAG